MILFLGHVDYSNNNEKNIWVANNYLEKQLGMHKMISLKMKNWKRACICWGLVAVQNGLYPLCFSNNYVQRVGLNTERRGLGYGLC